MDSKKILVVEDNEHINSLICRNLSLIGYHCVSAYDGTDMMKELHNTNFNLILLDVMLPGKSGYELIEEIKNIPVIYVTAKGELEDKLKGLALGAEDYIVKPFEMLELIARVQVVLRRNQRQPLFFKKGDVTVNLDTHVVTKNNQIINLTPREYDLLSVLIENRNIALSRDKLLSLAWGYDYEGETKTVDVHIQRLRKKLEWENTIKTVMKFGYRLED